MLLQKGPFIVIGLYYRLCYEFWVNKWFVLTVFGWLTILTILWYKLYRCWILSDLYFISILSWSDLEDRGGLWFFLQSLFFVKMQTKRGLEKPIIALESDFKKSQWSFILLSTRCASVTYEMAIAAIFLFKLRIWKVLGNYTPS